MSSPRVRISTVQSRATVPAGVWILLLEPARTASSLRACCSVVPAFNRAFTSSTRPSRSSKNFFCGSVENRRAMASGM